MHGDVRDYDAFGKVILNSEVIFHKAGAVGVGQSQYQIKKYVDVNEGGTANLLDILVNNDHRVKKLIVAASMSSYGEGCYRRKSDGAIVRPKLRESSDVVDGNWEPVCPDTGEEIEPIATPESAVQYCNSIYAITKKNQEEMVMNVGKTYGIPVVALRYFNVYGPRQSLSNPYTGVVAIFMSRIKNDPPPVVYEDGLQTRDFISVHDVARANILAMEKDEANYGVLNVGTGIPMPIKRIAEILAELYGKDIQPEITNQFRKGDVRHCYSDNTKIRKKLGFEPQVSFEDGMKELIEWSKKVSSTDKFEMAAAELREKNIISG